VCAQRIRRAFVQEVASDGRWFDGVYIHSGFDDSSLTLAVVEEMDRSAYVQMLSLTVGRAQTDKLLFQDAPV